MDIQGLKDKILQLAIQGKLVEQDKNDEPASVLLERIKEERDKLVKEGKIKKQKSLSEVTNEEKPFEIPESWEWVRLGEIGDWGSGATPKRSNPKYYENGTIPWLKTGELNNNYIKNSEEYITEEAFKETSVRMNQVGDVLIAMYGATIGKLGILEIEATTNQACCACTTFNGVFNRYLFYYLLSQGKNFKDKSEGGAQPNISKEKIVNHTFSLPPLAEQKRIVEKVDQLFALIDALDSNKEDLLEVINLTRNQVLQEAIQGKLVEQNPEDEPASALVQRIKEKRDKLVREGKIRKPKKLPPIEEEEKPFEIPGSWEWVRLGEIIRIYSGKGLTSKNMIVEGNIPVYGGNGITGYHNDYNIEKPTIVIGRVGFYCGSIHLVTEKAWITDNAFITDYSEDNIYLNFLKYLLKGTNLRENDNATAQPVISGGKIYPIIVALPPLAEQKRIVEKVDMIMDMLDELEKELIINI